MPTSKLSAKPVYSLKDVDRDRKPRDGDAEKKGGTPWAFLLTVAVAASVAFVRRKHLLKKKDVDRVCRLEFQSLA